MNPPPPPAYRRDFHPQDIELWFQTTKNAQQPLSMYEKSIGWFQHGYMHVEVAIDGIMFGATKTHFPTTGAVHLVDARHPDNRKVLDQFTWEVFRLDGGCFDADVAARFLQEQVHKPYSVRQAIWSPVRKRLPQVIVGPPARAPDQWFCSSLVLAMMQRAYIPENCTDQFRGTCAIGQELLATDPLNVTLLDAYQWAGRMGTKIPTPV